MAYEQIGVAGLTEELRLTYLRGMLDRLVPKLVHTRYGKKAAVPTRGGKAAQWRRLERPVVTTTALTEGTPGAATQVTVTAVSATVSQYGQYTQLTDVVQTQTIDSLVMEIAEAYGENMGDTIDQVVRNVMVAGTNVQYASTVGSRGGFFPGAATTGQYLNYAEIRKAVNTLERADAKRFADGAFKAIIHPDTKRDLFADTNILTTFQNAGPRTGANQIMQGEIGRFYGCDFVETTNARIFSSAGLSGCNVYATLFIGQDAYGVLDYESSVPNTMDIIVKPLGSAGTSDPLNQVSTVGWKAAVTAAILQQAAMVRVEHVTSRSSAA